MFRELFQPFFDKLNTGEQFHFCQWATQVAIENGVEVDEVLETFEDVQYKVFGGD